MQRVVTLMALNRANLRRMEEVLDGDSGRGVYSESRAREEVLGEFLKMRELFLFQHCGSHHAADTTAATKQGRRRCAQLVRRDVEAGIAKDAATLDLDGRCCVIRDIVEAARCLVGRALCWVAQLTRYFSRLLEHELGDPPEG